MKIDFDLCFILAAGEGTRMGKIGKLLPKPLWPINNKVLIDLQISYAKSLGAKKIYINTHYKSEEISKYVKHFYKDINLLFENVLLDMGGAIENLKRNVSTGKVLILNSDQLLFFEKSFVLNHGFAANLLCVPADPNEKYNKTILKNGQVTGIEIYNEGLKDYFTYSGVSLIDLDYVSGGDQPRKLFYNTLDFSKHKIQATELTTFDYFDFGTKERYIKNVTKLNSDLRKNQRSGSSDFYKKNLSEIENNNEEFYNQKEWCQSLREVFGFALKIEKNQNRYFLSLNGITDEVSC